MKQIIIPAVLACFAFVACKKEIAVPDSQPSSGSELVTTTSTLSQGHTVVTDEISGFVITNDCTGEILTSTSGTAHINIRPDGNVSSIVISHFAFQSDNGTIYHGGYNQTYAIYKQSGGTVTFRFAFHPVGGGPDINFHGVFHTTINANGVVTVEFEKSLNMSC